VNILITGGAGFIGSTFVEQCVNRDYNVIVLDALTYAGHKENLQHIQKNYKFFEGDICDRRIVDKILNEEKIDKVVNFAAESHVDNSIASADIFIKTNINGTYTLLEESRRYWNKLRGERKENFRYVQISTDEVYGELDLKEDRKFNEETNYNPSSPYSSSKAAGDHMTLAWSRTYGLPAMVTNCSNNYGPRQFPEKLIPYMISCALSGEIMPVYGDGENIRDWIHVSDHCNGVHLALTKGIPGQTYCFGGDAERSNITLVTKICEILDDLLPKPRGKYEEQIKFVKDRAGHDRRYAIDDSKAVEKLGFKREYEFDDGLKNTVQWYLKNTKWQAQVISKKRA
jgi:dTDP-glucose 4,6-dehydratase